MIYSIDVDKTKRNDISVVILDDTFERAHQKITDDTRVKIEPVKDGAFITIGADAEEVMKPVTRRIPVEPQKEELEIKKKRKSIGLIQDDIMMDDEPLETKCCQREVCCDVSLELYFLATLSLACLCLIIGMVYLFWKINGGSITNSEIQVMIDNSIDELELGTTIGEYIDLGLPSSSNKIRIKNDSGVLSISSNEFQLTDGLNTTSIIYSSPTVLFDTDVDVDASVSAESFIIGDIHLTESNSSLNLDSPLTLSDSITLTDGTNSVVLSIISGGDLNIDQSVYVDDTLYADVVSSPTVKIGSATLTYSTPNLVSSNALTVYESLTLLKGIYSTTFTTSSFGVSVDDTMLVEGDISIINGSMEATLSYLSGTNQLTVDTPLAVIDSLSITDASNSTFTGSFYLDTLDSVETMVSSLPFAVETGPFSVGDGSGSYVKLTYSSSELTINQSVSVSGNISATNTLSGSNLDVDTIYLGDSTIVYTGADTDNDGTDDFWYVSIDYPLDVIDSLSITDASNSTFTGSFYLDTLDSVETMVSSLPFAVETGPFSVGDGSGSYVKLTYSSSELTINQSVSVSGNISATNTLSGSNLDVDTIYLGDST
ncbi:hypothetical protein ADUPG1_008152, partial [Aduncisulcus paluster]